MIERNTALLLIDIQKGLDEWDFYGGNRNNPKAEENMTRLLNRFREEKLPIFHVQHSSQNPDSPLHPSKPGFEIKNEVKPLSNEPLFIKNVNSAFIGTDLEDTLHQQGISTLIVVGLTTNHCISTSVRMAANLGFKVYLVCDATATFDSIAPAGEKFPAELMHQTALASLNREFAEILTATEVLGKF